MIVRSVLLTLFVVLIGGAIDVRASAADAPPCVTPKGMTLDGTHYCCKNVSWPLNTYDESMVDCCGARLVCADPMRCGEEYRGCCRNNPVADLLGEPRVFKPNLELCCNGTVVNWRNEGIEHVELTRCCGPFVFDVSKDSCCRTLESEIPRVLPGQTCPCFDTNSALITSSKFDEGFDDTTSIIALCLIVFLPFIIIPCLIVCVRGVKRVANRSRSLRRAARRYDCCTPCAAFIWKWTCCGCRLTFGMKPSNNATVSSPSDLRETFRVWLWSSNVGRNWMIVQIFATLFACVILVIEFYINDFTTLMLVCEVGYTLFFLADYLIFFYVATDRLKYFGNIFSLIDLLTIIPVFALLVIGGAERDSSSIVAKFLRALRAVRALRIVRAYRVISVATVGKQRQVAIIAFTMGSMLFIFTTFLLLVEQTFSAYPAVDSFHMALYWVVVTLSTVGFGDIQPHSVTSRMVMTLLIATGWFIMSMNLAQLIKLVSDTKSYQGEVHVSRDKQHVLVSGVVTLHGLIDFLREFFHPDAQRQRADYRVVILSTESPTLGMEAMLSHPFYEHKVKFLVGSVLFEDDLRRAGAEKARACFLLTNKYAAAPDVVDAQMIVNAFSVVEFCERLRERTYVQLIRREAKHHLTQANIKHVMCLDELKLGLMGQSCVAPGLSTLLTNLVRTYTAGHGVVAEPGTWQQEYFDGCCNEVYSVPLTAYVGKTLGYTTLTSYRERRATLFAVEITDGHRRPIVISENFKYHIREGDVGFFICNDPSVLNTIGDWGSFAIKSAGRSTAFEVVHEEALVRRKSLEWEMDAVRRNSRQAIEAPRHDDDAADEKNGAHIASDEHDDEHSSEQEEGGGDHHRTGGSGGKRRGGKAGPKAKVHGAVVAAPQSVDVDTSAPGKRKKKKKKRAAGGNTSDHADDEASGPSGRTGPSGPKPLTMGEEKAAATPTSKRQSSRAPPSTPGAVISQDDRGNKVDDNIMRSMPRRHQLSFDSATGLSQSMGRLYDDGRDRAGSVPSTVEKETMRKVSSLSRPMAQSSPMSTSKRNSYSYASSDRLPLSPRITRRRSRTDAAAYDPGAESDASKRITTRADARLADAGTMPVSIEALSLVKLGSRTGRSSRDMAAAADLTLQQSKRGSTILEPKSPRGSKDTVAPRRKVAAAMPAEKPKATRRRSGRSKKRAHRYVTSDDGDDDDDVEDKGGGGRARDAPVDLAVTSNEEALAPATRKRKVTIDETEAKQAKKEKKKSVKRNESAAHHPLSPRERKATGTVKSIAEAVGFRSRMLRSTDSIMMDVRAPSLHLSSEHILDDEKSSKSGPSSPSSSSSAPSASSSSSRERSSSSASDSESSSSVPWSPRATDGFETESGASGGEGLDIEDHIVIIVCGQLMENIAHVIAPLRSMKLREHRDIVVLYQSSPSNEQWHSILKTLQGVTGVYFVVGSPLLHLSRTAIEKASECIVLNNAVKSDRSDVELSIDSDAIIATRSIERQYRQLRFSVAEVSQGPSIRFLGELAPSVSHADKYHALGAGRTAIEVAEDADYLARSRQYSLLMEKEQRQAASQRRNKWKSAVSGGGELDIDAVPEYHFRPRFASGAIFSASLLDSLACCSYLNPAIESVTPLFVNASASTPQVFHCSIPARFVGGRYDEVFEYFIRRRRMICIGLYRSAGHGGSVMPYVVTNPRQDTVVYARDFLFVLAPLEPGVQTERAVYSSDEDDESSTEGDQYHD